MTSTQDTRDAAQNASSTAADEGRHVAEVARDEARNVAGEAAVQARNLVEETRGQITEQVGQQARGQRDNLVSTLRTFSSDLDSMTPQAGPGLASDLVRELADRARALTGALEDREPEEMLEDVRRFARRRPGLFLLGALAAGMVAGRVVRGAKQASSEGTAATTEATTPASRPDSPTGSSDVSPSTPLSSEPTGGPAVGGVADTGYDQRRGLGGEGSL